ncbi:MAG: hypothetical protein WKF58_02720 [Ilumatobacteraceae bacterium]
MATQGIAEWTRSDIGAGALSNLTHPVGDVSLLPRGHGPITDDPARWSLLATWLTGNGPGVVDAGTGDPPVTLAQSASELLLVTRPCYLALVRASRIATRPTGVVVIDEPGRALTLGDIERAVGAPVVARILLDPAVARAVDAGLLAHAVPRRLARHLRQCGRHFFPAGRCVTDLPLDVVAALCEVIEPLAGEPRELADRHVDRVAPSPRPTSEPPSSARLSPGSWGSARSSATCVPATSTR